MAEPGQRLAARERRSAADYALDARCARSGQAAFPARGDWSASSACRRSLDANGALAPNAGSTFLGRILPPRAGIARSRPARAIFTTLYRPTGSANALPLPYRTRRPRAIRPCRPSASPAGSTGRRVGWRSSVRLLNRYTGAFRASTSERRDRAGGAPAVPTNPSALWGSSGLGALGRVEPHRENTGASSHTLHWLASASSTAVHHLTPPTPRGRGLVAWSCSTSGTPN